MNNAKNNRRYQVLFRLEELRYLQTLVEGDLANLKATKERVLIQQAHAVLGKVHAAEYHHAAPDAEPGPPYRKRAT